MTCSACDQQPCLGRFRTQMVFLDIFFFLFLTPASEEASTLLKDGFGPQRSNSNTYILAECKQKSLSRTIRVIINIIT